MSYYAENEESLLQNRSPAVVILMQSFGNKQKILHECSCQLNLLNELRKRDEMRGLLSILSLFPASLINSIIQEHACYILYIIIILT